MVMHSDSGMTRDLPIPMSEPKTFGSEQYCCCKKNTCPSNSTNYLKLAAPLPHELYLATAATGP